MFGLTAAQTFAFFLWMVLSTLYYRKIVKRIPEGRKYLQGRTRRDLAVLIACFAATLTVFAVDFLLGSLMVL